MTTFEKHLYAKTPKKILALDGGGIRGAFTLGYLQKIEDTLREANGNDPNFRLSDYFDLIGGTSTGSIIAGCLATGMKVSEIKEHYFNLGGKIFAKKKVWWARGPLALLAKAAFDSTPLETELKNLFGDTTIGDRSVLKTGLCIVTKRADTNSTWPIINHPDGKYFNTADGSNHSILLRNAIRASAAAPTYYVPEIINVGGGMPDAAFVDGGVSMANNPALVMLMVATLSGFPFHWPLGEKNLLVVSVGTGYSKKRMQPKAIMEKMAVSWATMVPDMLMHDASLLNQVMLQWISNSPTALNIDGEMGSLNGDMLTGSANREPLISYLRYNTLMNPETLQSLTGETYSEERVNNLLEMSNTENRFILYELGEKAAAREIKPEHFPGVFNMAEESAWPEDSSTV
jgi:patatin-like phospholipase/acyl hydrolase